MAEGTATVRNSAGIHVRPSGVILKAFADYPGKITLAAKGREVELPNLVGLIALGLQENDTVSISVDGPDDESTCAAVVRLIEKRFDFPQKG